MFGYTLTRRCRTAAGRERATLPSSPPGSLVISPQSDPAPPPTERTLRAACSQEAAGRGRNLWGGCGEERGGGGPGGRRAGSLP